LAEFHAELSLGDVHLIHWAALSRSTIGLMQIGPKARESRPVHMRIRSFDTFSLARLLLSGHIPVRMPGCAERTASNNRAQRSAVTSCIAGRRF
jgi:hypothetical protein